MQTCILQQLDDRAYNVKAVMRDVAFSASVTRSTTLLQRLATVAAAIALASLALNAPAMADPQTANSQWVSIAPVRGSRPPVSFTAAGYPRPGASLIQQLNDTEVTECTISWAVMSVHNDVGYLTAGHCDRTPGAPLWMYTNISGTERLPLSALQNDETGVDGEGHKYDAALFFLSPEQQQSTYGTSVDDRISVQGVMAVSDVQTLPVGTPICMRGARSGLTCGPLIGATGEEIEWGGAAVKGDSGAPVFVVNPSGEAMAIGMLHGGPSLTDNFATYLAPTLQELNVRLIVDTKKGQ